MSPVDPDSSRSTEPTPKVSPAEPATTEEDDSWLPAPAHHRNYSAAVYGSVLAATVVISSGDLRAPLTLAALLLSSGVVFWLAHVYAATVAGVHGGWHTGAIWAGMRHEWPVAFAAVPPAAVALLTALLPHVSVTDGVWAAFVVCIAEQQLWGYAAVRHAKLTGKAATRTMLLNVVMGFIIIALKLAIGH